MFSLGQRESGLRNEPPNLAQQAANIGGEYGRFVTPKFDHTYYFNPGVMALNGRRYLVARKFWMDYVQYWNFRSCASIMEIHDDMTLGKERILTYNQRDPRESIEDPRVAMVGGKPLIGVCAWVPPVQHIRSETPKIVIHQSALRLNDDMEVTEIWDPEYGGNSPNLHYGTGHEKNWLWFEHDGKPHFVYSTEPHLVCEWDPAARKVTREHRTFSAMGWTLGTIRGGTPPVRMGDYYVSFFHSSMPWKRTPKYGVRRIYFMGAYVFEAKPPFQVVASTRTNDRILTGTWNEPVAEGVPAVVYPNGALLDWDNSWFITLGVNDCGCGWLRLPHAALEARLTPCA